MNNTSLVLLVCLVPLAFLGLMLRYRTALLGLSILNVFQVASASLSGFVFGSLMGLPMDWFTAAHESVVKYSVAGCLAMAAGMFLAWQPLFRLRTPRNVPDNGYPPTPGWFNPTFGWLTFGVGVAVTIVLVFLGSIPTVSTALNSLRGLTRLGMFVLLVVALRNQNWWPFCLAAAIALPVLLVGALNSGHTPLAVNLILPLVVIAGLYQRASLRSLFVAGVAGVLSVLLMSAWMNTRGIIRSGDLDQYGLLPRAKIFLPAFVDQLDSSALYPENVQSMILERIDMSELLASQMVHQPDYEPYALGATFLQTFPALIPRIVWPEKPQVAGGSAFVMRFTGLSRKEEDTTSIGLPYQFEFFANGGPWLVFAGLFVVGYLSGRLELSLFREFSNLGKLWALVVATLEVCDGGQRMDVVLPSLVAGTLSAYFAGWCLERFAPELARRILGVCEHPAALSATEEMSPGEDRRFARGRADGRLREANSSPASEGHSSSTWA